MNAVLHAGLFLLATPNLTRKSLFLVNLIILWLYNCMEGAGQWNSKLELKHRLPSYVITYAFSLKPPETG